MASLLKFNPLYNQNKNELRNIYIKKTDLGHGHGIWSKMGQNKLAEEVFDSIPGGRKFDALQKQKKKEISDQTCTAWFEAIKDGSIVLPFLDHIASLDTIPTPQELKAIEHDELETWRTYCSSS